LIIHDQRRLLLRDPELPDVMLPAEWPGQKARLLCKELYRRLAPASERHPDRCLVLADGTIPPADPAFADRFPQDDPLAAMSLYGEARNLEVIWSRPRECAIASLRPANLL
jgi:phenylacetic acid degradation operon negative regulatory protein